MVPTPLINGNRYSFASIELVIQGLPYPGCKSISFTPNRTSNFVYGTGVEPIGRTAGTFDGKGSMDIYLSDWNDMCASLVSSTSPNAPTPNVFDLDFSINVMFQEFGAEGVSDVVLEGCRISSPDFQNQQGNDASTVKISYTFMRLTVNGIPYNRLPF